jgi:hypothetical protein
LKKSLIGALICAVVATPLAGVALPSAASAAVTTEGFTTVPPAGWTTTNNSSPLGDTTVFQGAGGPFVAQAGADDSFAAMNFNSTGGTGTISTWLVTPQYTSLSNGDVVSFYTRKTTVGAGEVDFPDRLEVRMSNNGSCSPGTGATSVGDFTTVLVTVNPALAVGGYPQTWTEFTATLSGITGAESGCFAFRYFVTNGGPTGSNGDYIGIDTYGYDDQPTDVTPPDTTITSTPNALSTSTSATFDFTSTEAGTFQCSVDGAPYAVCSGSGTHTVNGLAEGDHTFAVRAVDLADNVDPTPATYAFTVDTTAPETTINSGPATGTTTQDTTPTFGFGSSEAGSTFECRVDPSVFTSCSSPLTTAALGDGAHTFEVRSTDAAGNPDPTPATSSFTVDATAPNTSITSGPATGTTTEDRTPTFGFGSSEAGSTFECRVDSSVFASCSSPLTTAALGDGAHTFEVRSTDAAGNPDPTPATSSFTVDATTAPDTSITSGPATGTTTEDTTPTFGFSSTDAGATFMCSVDAAGFGPCSGPGATNTTAVLPLGAHTFSVRATDAVGNTDASPATSSFTVVAPSTPPADCSPYSSAVAKAKAKVAKAKAKLKKAKKGGHATAVKSAKAKLKKAKKALKGASAALTTCQAS